MSLRVLATGPLTTVQDAGRLGLGSSGIGRSGACDRTSYALANELVGNPPGAAALEVTLGRLVLRAEADVLVATAGAGCDGFPHRAATLLRAGGELRLGAPRVGLRTYVAVRGGIAVDPVLGSRSTDLLADLGPPKPAVGDLLPVGAAGGRVAAAAAVPSVDTLAENGPVRVCPGPRRDWFTEAAWHRLLAATWTVRPDSSRIGVRLDGPPLDRLDTAELPSEGLVRGAVQVPPTGPPVIFLADHPVTGGYPVIAYVDDEDVDRCAQLRPGQALRLRPGQDLPLG